MPIYAYACNDCGHAQDFLQKMSDPLIAVCPSCGSANFRKQLTAAGFQLKGGGWYVTDFRDGGKKEAKKADAGAGDAKAESTAEGKSGADVKAGSEAKGEGKGAESKSAESAPATTPSSSPVKPAATPSTGSTPPAKAA